MATAAPRRASDAGTSTLPSPGSPTGSGSLTMPRARRRPTMSSMNATPAVTTRMMENRSSAGSASVRSGATASAGSTCRVPTSSRATIGRPPSSVATKKSSPARASATSPSGTGPSTRPVSCQSSSAVA